MLWTGVAFSLKVSNDTDVHKSQIATLMSLEASLETKQAIRKQFTTPKIAIWVQVPEVSVLKIKTAQSNL